MVIIRHMNNKSVNISKAVFYALMSLAIVMQPVLIDIASEMNVVETKSVANIVFSVLWVVILFWRSAPSFSYSR